MRVHRTTRKGMMIGAGVGAGLGALAGASSKRDDQGVRLTAKQRIKRGMIGATAGAVGGAGLGGSITKAGRGYELRIAKAHRHIKNELRNLRQTYHRDFFKGTQQDLVDKVKGKVGGVKGRVKGFVKSFGRSKVESMVDEILNGASVDDVVNETTGKQMMQRAALTGGVARGVKAAGILNNRQTAQLIVNGKARGLMGQARNFLVKSVQRGCKTSKKVIKHIDKANDELQDIC